MPRHVSRTPNSPGPYYGDGTHRGEQGYAYSIYFGERHYEWLANTAGRRGVSRARVIKELIDAAMQWDEVVAEPRSTKAAIIKPHSEGYPAAKGQPS